ncbi:MAG TPA: TonB-dependent receptor [Gemmatimonadaceae bacterium]|nr:TonB-dependent receptor [Gemmatimonadaceae bacterium]
MRSTVRSTRAARCALIVVPLFAPSVIRAQQPTRDTTARDTTTRKSTKLQAVTITTTRADRDEPRAITNVAPQLIRLTPATNTWDLVRQTAGIEVHDQGQGPGFASDASIRAFSSDHSTDLALWIDGVPVNEPVNGHAEGYNDWSLLFPEAINDFDVIKGPTSALFGNFALAGVVNVRTLERMRGTEGFLTGGAYGRLEGTVLSGFDHDSSSGVFGLRAMREDGWRPNSGYSLLQGHGRAVRHLSPNATVDAGVELYGTTWDSPGFITADQFERGAFDSVANPTDGGFKRRAQERVSLRMLRGSSIWRSTLYATQSRWELFLTTPPEGGGEEGSGAQTEEQDSRYGLGATSAYSVGFARGEVTAGAEGRFDRSRYENWQDSARTRIDPQERDTGEQLSGAAFLQTRVDASERLTLSIGARYDALRTRVKPVGGESASDSHGTFSPKLGALFKLTPVLAAYANASRGFRSPDNINAFPTLGFITAWSYEAGLKLDKSRVSATAAAFQMDVSDEQQFSEICACSVSGGASRRRGVELSGEARVARPVTVSTDWTINDAKYRSFTTEDGDVLMDEVRVFNTARYVGIAAIAVSQPSSGVWTVRVSTNVVGPYTPFDEEPGLELPAYALLHLSGRVRFAKADLEVGVRNLLDRDYPELRAGGFVAPGQPRSFLANIRYMF